MVNETASVLKKAIEKIRESPFPSLDKLADEFCEKNKPVIKQNYSRIVSTDGGIVIDLGKNNLVLLSIQPKGDELLRKILLGNQLEFYIGGDGSHRYSINERGYILSGLLNNKKILLETTITEIQDYVLAKRKMGPSTFAPFPEINGKPRITYLRKDNFPYWFITKPNKKE